MTCYCAPQVLAYTTGWLFYCLWRVIKEVVEGNGRLKTDMFPGFDHILGSAMKLISSKNYSDNLKSFIPGPEIYFFCKFESVDPTF